MESGYGKYKQYYKDGILWKMIYRKLIDKTRPLWIVLTKLCQINSNKVCFDSFEGAGFSGDPKYICLELMKRRPDLKIVWFVRKKMDNFPEEIKQVYIDGILAVYHQSTAKVWVDNTRTGHRTKKRVGQYYLQTWHGQVVSKKIEKDAEDKLWPSYIAAAKYDGKITDAVMSSNEFFENIFKTSFWYSNKISILRYGSPSNDILFRNLDIDKIRNNLGIERNSFVILYAPTFRDDMSINGYMKDYYTLICAFEKKFHKKCTLLLRYHPDIAEKIKRINDIENVLDVTMYPDVKELVCISDFIITDYSSIISDFIITKKPGIRYCADLKDYLEIRGMYDIFYELPYEVVTTEKDLESRILEFDINHFGDNLDDFLERYTFYDDGRASIQAVDWINESLNR